MTLEKVEMEPLRFEVVLPRAWPLRLWLSGLLFRAAAWVVGGAVSIKVDGEELLNG